MQLSQKSRFLHVNSDTQNFKLRLTFVLTNVFVFVIIEAVKVNH